MREDLRIDWTIPATPSGWEGGLERFMGPGKSRVEFAVELWGGVVTAGLLGLLIWRAPEREAWSWLQTVVVVLVGFDLVGGVLTNATNAAKRWYHRDASSRGRLAFVASHLLHLLAVGFLVLGQDWRWSLINAGLLFVGAVLVERIPAEGKRPVAMAAFMVALVVNLSLFPLPPSLAWIPPLFFLKLLVGHLVPEAPLYRRGAPHV